MGWKENCEIKKKACANKKGYTFHVVPEQRKCDCLKQSEVGDKEYDKMLIKKYKDNPSAMPAWARKRVDYLIPKS